LLEYQSSECKGLIPLGLWLLALICTANFMFLPSTCLAGVKWKNIIKFELLALGILQLKTVLAGLEVYFIPFGLLFVLVIGSRLQSFKKVKPCVT
jgi:hypothetical protein